MPNFNPSFDPMIVFANLGKELNETMQNAMRDKRVTTREAKKIRGAIGKLCSTELGRHMYEAAIKDDFERVVAGKTDGIAVSKGAQAVFRDMLKNPTSALVDQKTTQAVANEAAKYGSAYQRFFFKPSGEEITEVDEMGESFAGFVRDVISDGRISEEEAKAWVHALENVGKASGGVVYFGARDDIERLATMGADVDMDDGAKAAFKDLAARIDNGTAPGM